MNNLLMPAIWVIVLIVGLPQFAETAYSPSLPDIAKDLATSIANVEYTLTIYLFGFAIGAIFFGNISDRFGRKPTMICGLILFAISCIGCYLATSIQILMYFVFIQAVGGSAGSVLGQAICRDVLDGKHLGNAFAIVSSVLSIFPAIGPIIGGFIAEYFGWRKIFIILFICAIILIYIVMKFLSETLLVKQSFNKNIITITIELLFNIKIWSYIIIIARCHGLIFSYYAEAPFYLMSNLGMTPIAYGTSFILIAISTLLGGLFSKFLNRSMISERVLYYALLLILVNEVIFGSLVLYYVNLDNIPTKLIIKFTILAHMIRMFGVCMANSNALALGLKDYKYSIGTASSIFSFIYCLLIALCTFGIGKLHNGSLLVMPLYFFGISILMLIIYRLILMKNI